jgi:hypothetical protein
MYVHTYTVCIGKVFIFPIEHWIMGGKSRRRLYSKGNVVVIFLIFHVKMSTSIVLN